MAGKKATHKSKPKQQKIKAVVLAVLCGYLLVGGIYAYYRQSQRFNNPPVLQAVSSPPTILVQRNLTYAQVPEGLKTAVFEVYKKLASPGCLENNTYAPDVNKDALVTAYVEDLFATSVTSCGQGSATNLYAYEKEEWKDLGATLSVYPCSVMEKYRVPAQLFSPGATKASCDDGTTIRAVNY